MSDAPTASRSAPPADMVGKALLLLSLVGAGPVEGRTLSDLAAAAGFPLSTAHRLAGTLVREGYLEVGPGRHYRLGLTVFGLAAAAASARGFDGVALPVLRALSADTHESSLMSVRQGHEQLYVHHVDGPRQVNVIGEPGRRGPLHCTSMGKVLIAFAAPEERSELLETLELTPLGPNTITDRDAFAEEIAEVRAHGYALADQEHEEGIRAVGVPVKSAAGVATAAVSVAAPAFRRSREDMIDLVPRLTAAARELEVLLPVR